MFRPSRASDLGKRVAAFIVAALVAFGLLSGIGGTPAVAALIATVSGQHEIELGATNEHFRLVLSHNKEVPARSVSHDHDLGSQLAMIFAEAEPQSDGDHVLHFDRLGNVTNSASRVAQNTPVKAPLLAAFSRQESPIFTLDRTHAGNNGKCGWNDKAGIPLGRSTVRLI